MSFSPGLEIELCLPALTSVHFNILITAVILKMEVLCVRKGRDECYSHCCDDDDDYGMYCVCFRENESFFHVMQHLILVVVVRYV